MHIRLISAVISVWFLIGLILYEGKPFNEQVLFIAQAGSLAVTLILLCIADKLNLSAVNYFYISIVGVRVAVTFLLLYLIQSDTQGFELIDPKNLHDSIPIIASPVLVLSFYNWKFDLLVGIPLTIVS